MPTRRTSPRRTAIRPTGFYERSAPPPDDFEDDPGPGWFAAATPWLAVLAVVLAAAAIGYVAIGRGGEDLTVCREAAWKSVPDKNDLPTDWALGSTDLNANGMTISVLGPASPDSSTDQPVVVVSVTCYGDAATAALDTNRKAAAAVNATVAVRGSGSDAYDVHNPSTGGTTTFFRVGGLVGQVADSGAVDAAARETITAALAAAMGDGAAAGTAGSEPSDAAAGSDQPIGSGDLGGPSGSPFAPDLEALLPKSITDHTSTASPQPVIPLTTQSASATDVFGDDPSSRALAARIRTLGGTLDQLQIAQAYDATGALDLSIIAFRLPRADLAKLRSAIIDTWLSAGAEGVKTTQVTLGGKNLTKVDYGDGSTIEYVYAKDDYVIVIDTSDVDVATQAAAQLK